MELTEHAVNTSQKSESGITTRSLRQTTHRNCRRVIPAAPELSNEQTAHALLLLNRSAISRRAADHTSCTRERKYRRAH